MSIVVQAGMETNLCGDGWDGMEVLRVWVEMDIKSAGTVEMGVISVPEQASSSNYSNEQRLQILPTTTNCAIACEAATR